MVDIDWSIEARTVVEIDIINIQIRVELVIQEELKEFRESGLFNVGCKVFNCARIPSFWVEIINKY